ncbi:hypothetical protein ACJMK2_018874 [Sinanodonta woodiana]|uniref:Centrosomal protein of 19 kDa n=1 Tax=Sinanodonta woodiana TaxID=1069815 RepID=A0ABD3UIB2_SINWO
MGDNEYEVKKCGVRFNPPAIVITYLVKSTSKLHRRTMPLRNFAASSKVEKAAEDLRTNPRHSKYISGITKAQLERLITIIRDKLDGMSLEASLARNDRMDQIDPEEDLNKVDEETLKRKKAVMDAEFEKHRIKPGDPGFQYDISVDFEQNGEVEAAGWDSDESEGEF